MNSKIFRQADSQWGKLSYPNKTYNLANSGCGCCAVTHCVIEIDKYSNYTPADVRKYMVQYATNGHGTLWSGITAGLKHYGYNVSQPSIGSSMKPAWDLFKKGTLKRGVILFGKTKGPDGTVWTTSGHYIAFVDYRIKDGKHQFYLKDSGGRKHDGWYSYETSMRGDVRNMWVCTSLKSDVEIKPITKPTGKYSGDIPVHTLKKDSKGAEVKKLQKFLTWYGIKCTVDGDFGSKTDIALKVFQKTEELTVDGVYGKISERRAKTYKETQSTPTIPTTPTKPIEDNLPKKCIDVSYWQGKISVANWEKIKKTCGYAICRASYTSQSKFEFNKDSTFAVNFTNARLAGLKVGAYHYSQAITINEAKSEAEYLCKILKNYKPDFYVVCDFEYGGRLNSKIGKKASDIANAFCDVVKSHGYEPCIYANTSTLNNNLTNPKYPVWVAQYNDKCTYKGDKVMWQYTSKGKVDGISAKNTNNGTANVDLSHVYKV